MKKLAVGAVAVLAAGAFLLHSPASSPAAAPPPFAPDRLLQRMLRDGQHRGSLDLAYVEKLALEWKQPPEKILFQALYCKDILNRYVRGN